MGSKVNPSAFRQTTTFRTPARWFASKQQFAQNLQTDIGIRKLIKTKFRDGGIASIIVERSAGELTLIVYTSKPGVIIGRGGSLIEELKKEIKQKFFGSEKMKVTINIQEVQNADINAELTYQGIRDQIEQRVRFRRAIKRSMEQVMRAGAKGCKIQISGRLNGAEIARSETIAEGRLPLHTLRADIDYSRGVANTVYGVIGIKVWIYKGDVFGEMPEVNDAAPKKKKPRRPSSNRKKLETGGQKLILRKKSDVDKDNAQKPAKPVSKQVEDKKN